MLRCAIVEDSPRELEHLKECLARYSAERDIPLETTAFGDAASFLEHYRADYDIVFMDIELPGINGMEAAHRLREIDRQVILIFVTNMAQFAVKGYEVDALDYIIKPAQYGPLSIKLDRAAQRWRAAAESVMVALPTGTQRLLLWEIYYIEVQGHKLTYHTEKGQLPGTGTLQDAEQRLHGKGFLRCNKCYLVNQKHIQTVTGSDVVLSNGEAADQPSAQKGTHGGAGPQHGQRICAMSTVIDLFERHGYVLELLACVAATTWKLERQERFAARLTGILLAEACFTIVWEQVPHNLYTESLRTFLL